MTDALAPAHVGNLDWPDFESFVEQLDAETRSHRRRNPSARTGLIRSAWRLIRQRRHDLLSAVARAMAAALRRAVADPAPDAGPAGRDGLSRIDDPDPPPRERLLARARPDRAIAPPAAVGLRRGVEARGVPVAA